MNMRYLDLDGLLERRDIVYEGGRGRPAIPNNVLEWIFNSGFDTYLLRIGKAGF